MLKRTITGILLLALIAGAFFLLDVSPHFFGVLIAVMAAAGIYEMATAHIRALSGDKHGVTGNAAVTPQADKPAPEGTTEPQPAPPVQRPFTAAHYVVFALFALLFLPAYIVYGVAGCLILLAFALLAVLSIMVFTPHLPIQSAGAAMLTLCYPAALMIFMLDFAYGDNALLLLLMTFIIAAAADTFAFFVGSTLKGPKPCPAVSPKKTISGAIGGLVGGVLAGLAIWLLFHYVTALPAVPALWKMLLAGLVGAAFTELGDLSESALKRRMGIKDFSKLLPGHGGVLDRIDGIIFNGAFLFVFSLILF